MIDDWEDYECDKLQLSFEEKRSLTAKKTERIRQFKAEGGRLKRGDYGRQAVYRSEWAAQSQFQFPAKKMTIFEMKVEAERIFQDERVMEIDPFPGEKIYIESSTIRGAIAFPFERRMRFGVLRDNYTLLHEIAHLLAINDLHGQEFCRILCLLHEWFISTNNARVLRSIFWN